MYEKVCPDKEMKIREYREYHDSPILRYVISIVHSCERQAAARGALASS